MISLCRDISEWICLAYFVAVNFAYRLKVLGSWKGRIRREAYLVQKQNAMRIPPVQPLDTRTCRAMVIYCGKE